MDYRIDPWMSESDKAGLAADSETDETDMADEIAR
jgi:hypothetical protein